MSNRVITVAAAQLGPLDMCSLGRATIFAFDKHRRPETYGRITGEAGAVEPPVWVKQAAE
jgi:hypothetical protein